MSAPTEAHRCACGYAGDDAHDLGTHQACALSFGGDNQPHYHVTYCSTECASHRCTRPCGRATEHPADEHGHICDDCASAIAGWF